MYKINTSSHFDEQVRAIRYFANPMFTQIIPRGTVTHIQTGRSQRRRLARKRRITAKKLGLI